MSVQTTIVVPCYNEAHRLRLEDYCRFLLQNESVSLLFVDDGSTDTTAELLAEFCQDMAGRCRLKRLPHNQGKAEAVRQGLIDACQQAGEAVGFWDADLATPLEEVSGFCQVLAEKPQVDWVFGSRVRLLGRAIERQPTRHYLGRAWATSVSLLLRLPIYDTQCGAKLFRASTELRELLAEPFLSRWVFDVELIARLLRRRCRRGVEQAIYELPLSHWCDVAGSKLRTRDFARASTDLVRIYWHYLRDMDVDRYQPPSTPQPPADHASTGHATATSRPVVGARD